MISRKRLRDFAARHPDADKPLQAWYRVMNRHDFPNFGELKRTFATADKVGPLTIFNISGNRYRLVASIHFNRRRVYVRDVLTHADYDRGGWQP